LVCPVCKSGIS
jgi:hypothetical protein